jgi:hypothetical protein
MFINAFGILKKGRGLMDSEGKGAKKQMHIKVPEDLHAEFKKRATMDGINVSAAITRFMRESASRISMNMRGESVVFIDEDHKSFFAKMALEPGIAGDVYRMVFFYAIGINGDARIHARDLYDFKNNWIKPEGLRKPWQTSGSLAATRLAFNLYNSSTQRAEADGLESESGFDYSPAGIFSASSDYLPYFFEAIRLRFASLWR